MALTSRERPNGKRLTSRQSRIAEARRLVQSTRNELPPDWYFNIKRLNKVLRLLTLPRKKR